MQINLQNDRPSAACVGSLSHHIHTWEAQTTPDNPSHTNTVKVIQQTLQSELSSKKRDGKLPGEGAEAGPEGWQPA